MVASAHAQLFPLVITVANTFPPVITIGNVFPLITVGNAFPLVITVGNTSPLVITVGNTFSLVITVGNTFPPLITVGKNDGLYFFQKRNGTSEMSSMGHRSLATFIYFSLEMIKKLVATQFSFLSFSFLFIFYSFPFFNDQEKRENFWMHK